MFLLSLLRVCFRFNLVKQKAKLCEKGIELVTRIEKGLYPKMKIQANLLKKY